MFYNPPMVNRNLGIRRSYINEATRVAKEILSRKLQTIVFANSRLHTEVVLTYLQQANPPKPGQAEPIRGYRGGYLPGERREIERGCATAASWEWWLQTPSNWESTLVPSMRA